MQRSKLGQVEKLTGLSFGALHILVLLSSLHFVEEELKMCRALREVSEAHRGNSYLHR